MQNAVAEGKIFVDAGNHGACTSLCTNTFTNCHHSLLVDGFNWMSRLSFIAAAGNQGVGGQATANAAVNMG
eukprot:COSAG01_NODE_53473_length_339_cov_0.600000_1_plen_70_part_01